MVLDETYVIAGSFEVSGANPTNAACLVELATVGDDYYYVG